MHSPSPPQPGAYYHIYNRGINRQDIFYEDANYDYFLRLLAIHIHPIADIYAYCLLRNHFHLLLRIYTEDELSKDLTGLGDLSGLPSKRFSNLFNAYAKAINKRHQRTGSLFQRPFGRVMVISNTQLFNLVVYIHTNPEKHGFVKDFRDWRYSSYALLINPQENALLNRLEVLEWFGNQGGFEASHQQPLDGSTIEPLVGEDDEPINIFRSR
jgi:putative transposase